MHLIWVDGEAKYLQKGLDMTSENQK